MFTGNERKLNLRLKRWMSHHLIEPTELERVIRIELTTFCLGSRRSTTELHPHFRNL